MRYGNAPLLALSFQAYGPPPIPLWLERWAFLLACMGLLIGFPVLPAHAGWSDAGTLQQARGFHTATLLPNGQVLVAGGRAPSGMLATAELYDPSTNSWFPTGVMHDARHIHQAVLLLNGRVLVAGGATAGGNQAPTASVEIYEPSSGNWFLAPPMRQPRTSFAAVALLDGRVMAIGGTDQASNSSMAEVEISFPGSDWSSATPLLQGRSFHLAVVLQDGRVLVVGGFHRNPTTGAVVSLRTAEIYNPQIDQWAPAGMIRSPLGPSGSLTVMSDGRAFLFNGTQADIYDPATNSWSAAADPLIIRNRYGVVTALPSGQVLLVGGEDTNEVSLASAESYDPVTDTWSSACTMSVGRLAHTVTVLAHGGVLVAAGEIGLGSPLASADRLPPPPMLPPPPAAPVSVPFTFVVDNVYDPNPTFPGIVPQQQGSGMLTYIPAESGRPVCVDASSAQYGFRPSGANKLTLSVGGRTFQTPDEHFILEITNDQPVQGFIESSVDALVAGINTFTEDTVDIVLARFFDFSRTVFTDASVPSTLNITKFGFLSFTVLLAHAGEFPGPGFLYLLEASSGLPAFPPPSEDRNGDGIADGVETEGGAFSDLSQGGTSFGKIVQRNGLRVLVEDADDPTLGLRVRVVGGGNVAIIQLCPLDIPVAEGLLYVSMLLTNGDSTAFTCYISVAPSPRSLAQQSATTTAANEESQVDAVTIQGLAGVVQLRLGHTVVVTIPHGAAAIITNEPAILSASDSTAPIFVQIQGQVTKLAPSEAQNIPPEEFSNHPPVAQCQNVAASTRPSACTASASVDAGSRDPDGDLITLTQVPAGPYSLGATNVTLTVTDNQNASNTCAATVTVVDTESPVITLNGTNPMTVECHTSFTDPGATSVDNCAGSVPVTASGSVNLNVPGTYTGTYTATDGTNTATVTRTVNVVDTTAPTITLTPSIALWPPNHSYQTVTVSQMVQSVNDSCSTLSISSLVIEKVTSDEPDDAPGPSDGSTTNDIVIASDCKSVQLRSERNETKNGRVYAITLRERDVSGNVTRAVFKGTVPLAQNNAPAVQDATAFTVTSTCP